MVQPRSRIIPRDDRNIRLNINRLRMDIITKVSRRLALDLRIIHLSILEIGRARTRTRQEQRVRVIGIDIRRPRSIARASQLKRREQTPDNRQVGADQANCRLDVRPQSRLVDGEGWVGRADPEEHDDAVDAGEADEAAESEHAVQGELVLPCAVEVPDHWDGQDEDHEVHDYVEGLVDDDEFFRVETCSFRAVVPVGA